MLKVCTIIINHNYGHWISDAINSAAEQDYPAKEIMIVDDGSTDNSLEVIQKLMGVTGHKHDTISMGSVQGVKTRLYSFEKAGGPSRARNQAIKLSWDADCFAVLDSDDIFRPGKLSKSILKLMENDLIGAVYGDYDVIDSETGVMRREYKEPFSYDRLLQSCIIHSACVIRKKAIEECGSYRPDLRVAEDYSLWLRISKKYMFVHIPESLMYVRSGMYNSTNSVPKEIWQDCHKKLTRDLNVI